MSKKLNCWQVMECGCEPGGAQAATKGICPAAVNTKYHGVNGGENSGRFCWTEPDAGCREMTGHNYADCLLCSFFKIVKAEQDREFVCTRSAFIAGANREQREHVGGEPCEYMAECGFFKNFGSTEITRQRGWINLFCNHQATSQYCERKIYRQKTGQAPPDNYTPVGTTLDPTKGQEIHLIETP